MNKKTRAKALYLDEMKESIACIEEYMDGVSQRFFSGPGQTGRGVYALIGDWRGSFTSAQ